MATRTSPRAAAGGVRCRRFLSSTILVSLSFLGVAGKFRPHPRKVIAFSSNVLSLERSGHVATLWLDRPEKRNAMTEEMWLGLPEAIAELGNDPEVRAVVLAGRGKSFCTGLDLAAVEAGGGFAGAGAGAPSTAVANLRRLEVTRAFQAGISAVEACPVPVIAAIHGHCLGGGMDLVTACDMRLASRNATFGVRETKLGIVADVGTLQRLPRIVSSGHVAELVYTGKDIKASRAEKIGLVNYVCEDKNALYEAAYDLANEIAANSPIAVRGTKFVLQQSEDLTTDQSLLLNGMWTLMTSLSSNDIGEAIKAFSERRPPQFDGT